VRCELGSDDHLACRAARTGQPIERHRRGNVRQRGGRWRRLRGSELCQRAAPTAVSEEAVVANPHESLGQDLMQLASQELFAFEGVDLRRLPSRVSLQSMRMGVSTISTMRQ